LKAHLQLLFIYFLFYFIFTSYSLPVVRAIELCERLDTVEEAGVVVVGEDVRETGGGVG